MYYTLAKVAKISISLLVNYVVTAYNIFVLFSFFFFFAYLSNIQYYHLTLGLGYECKSTLVNPGYTHEPLRQLKARGLTDIENYNMDSMGLPVSLLSKEYGGFT